MKYLPSLSCRVGTWLCALAGACCVFGGGNAIAARAIVKPAQGGEVWLAASNKTLDGMRGGFDIGAGLMVSFGVVRSIAINGNLLVTTSFNIADLSKITPVQATFINQQVGALNLIQNGPGNTVQPSTPVAAAGSCRSSVSIPEFRELCISDFRHAGHRYLEYRSLQWRGVRHVYPKYLEQPEHTEPDRDQCKHQ